MWTSFLWPDARHLLVVVLFLCPLVMGKPSISHSNLMSFIKVFKSFCQLSNPHLSQSPKSFKSNLQSDLRSFMEMNVQIHFK